MSQLGLGMKTETQERTGRRPSRNRRGGFAVLVAAVVVLAVLGLLVAGVVRTFAAKPDYTGNGHGQVLVQVRTGDSVSQVAATLERIGVIRTAATFVEAADGDALAANIQPGTYKLRLQMSATAALALLLDPAAKVSSRVLIPEGKRLDQVVALLARGTKIPAKDLLAALAAPGKLGLPDYAGANAEGFLFPATYDVEPGSDAQHVLRAMVKRFAKAEADTQLLDRAAAVHLTPYQVVVVASMVQAEGRTEDFPRIARAILNRLAKGMKLQLNSTVNYVLKNDKDQLTNDDIAVQSPYNTYLVGGLPPGPIDSPGEDAINAVLAPATGNWLYWVTTDPKTGETKFTASYAEFLQFKAELQANGG